MPAWPYSLWIQKASEAATERRDKNERLHKTGDLCGTGQAVRALPVVEKVLDDKHHSTNGDDLRQVPLPWCLERGVVPRTYRRSSGVILHKGNEFPLTNTCLFEPPRPR